MAHTNARAYLPPSARAARVPSRHGLRNAYSTQLSYRRVSLSSAIGGRATLSSRTRAEPRSVASARELGRLPQSYYLYGEDSRPTMSGAQQEGGGADLPINPLATRGRS